MHGAYAIAIYRFSRLFARPDCASGRIRGDIADAGDLQPQAAGILQNHVGTLLRNRGGRRIRIAADQLRYD